MNSYRTRGTCRLLCSTLFMLVARSSMAHPVSMSDAVIDLYRDRTEVQLQVLVEELTLHYPISADGTGTFPAQELRQHAAGHAAFLRRDLRLLDGTGHRLQLLATDVSTDAIPDHGVPQTDLKNLSVTYRFRFSSVGETGFLTVSQAFGGKEAILPSIMDCMVLQAGVLAEAPAQLTARQLMTVKVDWDSPPKPLKNWRELRLRREQQRRTRLGIASYSGLYSFIYVTPHEVRHEVLVPLLTLESWLPIPRTNADFLDVNEQTAARKRIETFFTRQNPVMIDGRRVEPVVDRISFFGLNIRDFAVNSTPRRVGVYQARVGIILVYPVAHTTRTVPGQWQPRSVQLQWNTFNRHAGFLRSIVYIHDDDPIEYFLRPDEDTFSWRNSTQDRSASTRPERIRIPPDRAPDKAESIRIAAEVLRNIYRAFEYRDEERTYDTLATGVDGRLLRSLYVQVRKSLLVAEQGNARSLIVAVNPLTGTLNSADKSGFELDFTWRATGQVEHWGHIHSRRNKYRARLTFSRTSHTWKLTACQFLSQNRLSIQTTLRTKQSPPD